MVHPAASIVTPVTTPRDALIARHLTPQPAPEEQEVLKQYRVTFPAHGNLAHRTVAVRGTRFTVDQPGILQVYSGREKVGVWGIGQWASIEVAVNDVENNVAEALREWAHADPEGDWDGAPEVARLAAELAEFLVEDVL